MVLLTLQTMSVNKLEPSELELACSIVETVIALNDSKLKVLGVQINFFNVDFVVTEEKSKMAIDLCMPIHSVASLYLMNLANVFKAYHNHLVEKNIRSNVTDELEKFIATANKRLNKGDDTEERDLTANDD